MTVDRLPRRDPRAEEAADHRRRDPAALPARLAEIEEIIRREKLVTPAEPRGAHPPRQRGRERADPAPHMRPPRLIGNTGESGEFVLPLRIPARPGGKAAKLAFDDFTFEAASWTLTAHEARPGHELQFATIIESGRVDGARALRLQQRERRGLGPLRGSRDAAVPAARRPAHRAAAPADARRARVPRSRAADGPRHAARRRAGSCARMSCSREAMAQQEVERYMFRAPGQATSYFFGYTQLRSCGPRSSARWAAAVRRPRLPRLRARAGAAAAGPPQGSRGRAIREAVVSSGRGSSTPAADR